MVRDSETAQTARAAQHQSVDPLSELLQDSIVTLTQHAMSSLGRDYIHPFSRLGIIFTISKRLSLRIMSPERITRVANALPPSRANRGNRSDNGPAKVGPAGQPTRVARLDSVAANPDGEQRSGGAGWAQ